MTGAVAARADGSRADLAADRSALPAGDELPPYEELPDAVLVLDGRGHILSLNSAAGALLGLDDAAVLGRPLTDVVTLLDERGNDWWECSLPLLRLPGVHAQPERRLVLTDDTSDEKEVLSTVRYVRSEGVVERIVICLRDTATRRRLDRSRADLVSTVAHELRSPLTSVKGFTATLLAKWERFTDEQKQLMLATVNADADRVTRLLAELLDVSRIDAGRLELRRQVVDLPKAVQRVIEGRVATGEPEERFQVRVTGELPEMWLDADKIDQVLHNLVENALRHGGGTVTIEVTATDGGAEVTITDEGSGIPDETRARIFTKFWRGGSRRGGTGLGLYIVKGIIEAHGGTIEAGRGAHGGAQFRFTVPAGTPAFM